MRSTMGEKKRGAFGYRWARQKVEPLTTIFQEGHKKWEGVLRAKVKKNLWVKKEP